MAKMFSKVWLLIAMSVCLIGTIFGTEIAEENCEQNLSHSEMALLVSLNDLNYEKNEISLNVGGATYQVYALEKQGDLWIARISGVNYCPQGHPNCRNCGLCHRKKCFYYIPPCKLWE